MALTKELHPQGGMQHGVPFPRRSANTSRNILQPRRSNQRIAWNHLDCTWEETVQRCSSPVAESHENLDAPLSLRSWALLEEMICFKCIDYASIHCKLATTLPGVTRQKCVFWRPCNVKNTLKPNQHPGRWGPPMPLSWAPGLMPNPQLRPGMCGVLFSFLLMLHVEELKSLTTEFVSLDAGRLWC